MKTTLLLSLTLAAGFAVSQSHAATVTVTSLSSDKFSPDSITLGTGDTVNFTIQSSHNALEVSQSTYNANGTTGNGGFNVPFGGGKLSGSTLTAGTHYYVCVNHVASMGMKGRLFVSSVTGINPVSQKLSAFTFQIAGAAPLAFQLPGETARISVMDIQGRVLWSTVTQNGSRNMAWDGKLADGSRLTAGTYFVQSVALDAAHKPVGQASSASFQIP